uniref:hypothetical protein n=1 Tax=Photorhabdus sp. RM322S TaxID=3342825 RepID=UPI0036DD0A17
MDISKLNKQNVRALIDMGSLTGGVKVSTSDKDEIKANIRRTLLNARKRSKANDIMG